MFGIDSSELFVIGMVALLVIGPQRLPHAMRMVGQWVAKGRAMTRHVRSGFDAMVREAELDEMQKAWAKQNEAIMKATAMDPTAFMDPGNANAALQPPETPATNAVPALADLTVPPPYTSEGSVLAGADEPQPAMLPAPDKPKRKRAPRKLGPEPAPEPAAAATPTENIPDER